MKYTAVVNIVGINNNEDKTLITLSKNFDGETMNALLIEITKATYAIVADPSIIIKTISTTFNTNSKIISLN